MNRFLLIVTVLLLSTFHALTRVFPGESSRLHYRIIGFSLSGAPTSTINKLEIAQGIFFNEDSFSRKIIISKDFTGNRLIAEVPHFSQQYTWRIVSSTKGPDVNKLYHFSTYIPDTNRLGNRLKVSQHATLFKDALIFLDDTRTLYDMNGIPVWHLPFVSELNALKTPVRDMKITSRGTITFLVEGNEAYEISYDGALLWKGPNTGEVSKVDKENYHHELTRLSNGHYMVLGTAPFFFNPPKTAGLTMQNPQDPSLLKKKPSMPFGTIIEYDQKGKVVWSWNSTDYFLNSDVKYCTDENGHHINDVHLNSFYFDEKKQVIYASYKNISRILKIRYPEGKVITTYGTKYSQGLPASDYLFCYQHACNISEKGHLYLFNNNSCRPDCQPEVLVLQEPLNANELPKIVWSFDCPVEPLNQKLHGNIRNSSGATTGGNVVELPDDHFFVSTSAPYALIFIVNKQKQIIWSASEEHWNPDNETYNPIPQYRASIIPKTEQFEKLVWNSQSF